MMTDSPCFVKRDSCCACCVELPLLCLEVAECVLRKLKPSFNTVDIVRKVGALEAAS